MQVFIAVPKFEHYSKQIIVIHAFQSSGNKQTQNSLGLCSKQQRSF